MNMTKFYYLYLKVSKTFSKNEEGLQIGTGDWYISEDPKDFDSNPNYYYLWAASINSEENGERQITLMHGFSELTPNMLRINNVASVDGNSFLKFLDNQFRIGDKERYLAWNVVKGLLEIVNATLEMRNAEGEVVSKIDGETGAAMFGKGANIFDGLGNVSLSNGVHKFNSDKSMELAGGNILYDLINGLLIRGKFESNKDGSRIVIDPEDRELRMQLDDFVAARMKFEERGGDIYPTLEFTSQKLGTCILRDDMLYLEDKDRKYSASLNAHGVTVYYENDIRNPISLRFDDQGRAEIITPNLPTNSQMLKSGRHWRDGENLKIVP